MRRSARSVGRLASLIARCAMNVVALDCKAKR
jgi:hypothetical protein